ncbi:hypothetical protein WN48_09795 [Eufriesea mexicana]|uniref:Uncharacterized protein n=1 Tax=Eufriesea mexicana TaxID=516756 RepID=A0A310SDX9_9HYME|nr:hypothetical protein WN48_09795 [Eufriesea mexicana]
MLYLGVTAISLDDHHQVRLLCDLFYSVVTENLLSYVDHLVTDEKLTLPSETKSNQELPMNEVSLIDSWLDQECSLGPRICHIEEGTSFMEKSSSADDVALSLSSPTTLDEPPGTSTSTPRDNCQSISPAALLRVSRTKYTRRSCGDASAMQALLASKQEQEQDVAEADYQMVTAVPAFIVEHEPEKQRAIKQITADVDEWIQVADDVIRNTPSEVRSP